MSTKSLADFGITESSNPVKETQALSQFVGQSLAITGIEFKKLGTRDGVILTLQDQVKDVDGEEWDKIHTSKTSIIEKLKPVALNKGDILSVRVVGGKSKTSGNRDWYDLKDA